MSYASVVDELRHKELELRAEAFAEAYDPHLPSVVLLPGGMGSRLLRSTAPYVSDEAFTHTLFYELWLDFAAALRGELAEIAMNEYGEDVGGHPIIASGELSSIVKKYEGVARYFHGKANYAGLGYDWRRAPAAEFMYVRAFLQRLADKVVRRGHADPRPQLTIYAHSQGGLIAKLLLNDIAARGEALSGWCERVVTCCTPFYGTWSHLSRYYVGEPFANIVTGGAAAVSRIVAAVKGPYVLLPAPKSVLAPHYAALGLDRYPVRDAADRSVECDPFAPAMRLRLPGHVVDDYLTAAGEQFTAIDAPLPDAVAGRVFHIRSTAGDGHESFEMYWMAEVRGDDPVSHNGETGGRHDGTVPSWSARLATTPDENVFDVSGVPHAGAAENATVLGILWDLMNGRAVPAGPRVTLPGPEFGDTHRVSTILAQVKSGTRPAEDLLTLPAPDFRTLAQGFALA